MYRERDIEREIYTHSFSGCPADSVLTRWHADCRWCTTAAEISLSPIYTCVYVYMCVYIYIYIYTERERENNFIYTYIYIYICIERERFLSRAVRDHRRTSAGKNMSFASMCLCICSVFVIIIAIWCCCYFNVCLCCVAFMLPIV